MEAERRKSIVAAILAVHSGRLSPDEAAEFLHDPGKVSESIRGIDGGAPVISVPGDDGGYHQYDLLEVVEDEDKSRRALADIGIEERAQDTLFSFGKQDNGREMKVLRDTLNAVAVTGARLTKSDMRAGSEPRAGSENPTVQPKEDTRTLRITTGKFLPNFGVSAERYDVRKEHARGGMGRVLLVRDRAIGRDIAMKELLPGVGSGYSIPAGVSESGGIVERFLREAKITGQLEHPNIVPVYEIGKHDDGSVYYTMRFIRGMTLSDKLREIRKDDSLDRKGKLAARIALLDRFLDVCDAISYAHSKKVIHRDLKPENIMLGEYGETLVLDWGLARVKGQEDKALRELQRGTLALSRSLVESDSQNLTQDGSIVGTPAYMPPEQARGELENVDEQSDVYALGAVLYQILSGSPPYEGPMAALIVQQVLAGPPLRLTAREPEVPPELGALVDSAMAREKPDRLGTVAELAREIKAFRDGRTLGVYSYSAREMITRFVKQHRTSVGVGVLGFLLLVAGAIVAWREVTKERDEARSAQLQAEVQRQAAQENLAMAQREKSERERLEREKLASAQAQLEGRVEEAQKLIQTIAGMRADQIAADLDTRIGAYEALAGEGESRFLELTVDERTGNGVLLSSIMGYVSAQQQLIDLLTGPAGARLPDALSSLDLEGERARLDDLRLRAARLATFNGDFPLADLMISGVADGAAVRAAREAVAAARSGLLALHARRIDEALADVAADLRRAGRPQDAPKLEDYARLLSSYRERETVARLQEPLRLVRLRCRDPLTFWTPAEVDTATLLCRVLGNVEQPKEAVPLLTGLLTVARHPVVVRECAAALCATKSSDAIDPLLRESRTRGLDFWTALAPRIALLPLPERLRQPQAVADHLDRSVLLRTRGDFVGAVESASRAVVLDNTSPEPLVARGLARLAAGDRIRAIEDFDSAINLDQRAYEAWLARGDARDLRMEGERAIADYTSAINLRPLDVRGYIRRAQAQATRYMFDQAYLDFDRAINLDSTRIESFIEYGQALFRRGLLPQAQAQFTRAIELEPDNWLGWHHRGVLFRENDFNRSLSDLRRAIELNPNDAKAYNWMSQCYYGQGQLLDGIRAATRAVEINPDEWLAYYYRGITYLRLQDAEDARSTGGTFDPTSDSAKKSMLSRAADDFAAASRINPKDYRSVALLGQTLLRLERFADARVAYTHALGLSPFGAGTLQMGNEFVKAGLIEIDAQPLLTREPANAEERIRKVRAHLGRQARHQSRRDEDLREARSQLLLLRAAVERRELDARQHYRYQVAEAMYAATLKDQRLWEEVVENLDDLEARRGLSGQEVAERASARLNLRQAILTRSLVLLEADDNARNRRLAEYASLTDAQVLARGTELLAAVLADLHTAVDEGWSNAPLLREDKRYGALAGNADFAALMEKMTAMGVQTGAAPDQPQGESVLVVTNVIEFAPADRMGLKAFDVITHVNGAPMRTVADLQAAMARIEENGDLEIAVRRYALTDGQPTPRKDAQGRVMRDERGLCSWEFTTLTFKGKRGFLGINLETGRVPAPEEE